jgi:mono/diheme cytochrome c family protein
VRAFPPLDRSFQTGARGSERTRGQSPHVLKAAAQAQPRPARPDDRHRKRRLRRAFLAVPLVVVALALAIGCQSGTGGLEEGGSAANGKQLFQEKCAGCHALADAGSQSTVGPNLDDAFAGVRKQGFKQDTIANVVADQIKYAVAPMPQNLVTGSDADDVAAYVASVAGTKGYSEEAGGTGKVGGTDGKAIFASAGCGSCHTFQAAGSNGTIGPNLDEARPSLELAIQRVTNGMGPMPSFKDRLSEAQIRAVAEFVSGGG